MSAEPQVRFLPLLLTSVLTLGLAGCGPASESTGAGSERTLTVFAAASLTGVFTELGTKFEVDHPGVRVAFNFGGSADLVAQIVEGAPADVFAAADATTMERLTDEGLEATTPEEFASNTLVIVTPADNPAGISTLADLTSGDVALALCAPAVPCGGAAQKVEAASGLDFRPVSEEQNVKDVLAKVAAGEADAGLVYVTDVRAAGDAVLGIAFPEAAEAVNRYPIVTLEDSANGDLADAFVDLVRGDQGQRLLAAAGFGPRP